jgi:thiamine kinase-like enzyme
MAPTSAFDSLLGALRGSFPASSVADDAVLVPLGGGITNRNYTVVIEGRVCVVREPGERTEVLGIDRAHEAQAAQRAAQLLIGPPVVGLLNGYGTLITELVPGRHLEGDQFVERLDEVVFLLKLFHASGSLGGSFPIHRVVEWHARDARRHGVRPPADYSELLTISTAIEAAFASFGDMPVPCHNDLLPANVLFRDQTAILLDFEYAGMNSRYFDLGNLAVNCELSITAEHRLLELYFNDHGEDDDGEDEAATQQAATAHFARLQLMKVMSEFREAMWAVVQQAISTLGTDFVSYAHERFESALSLARSPDFPMWIEVAARPDPTL